MTLYFSYILIIQVPDEKFIPKKNTAGIVLMGFVRSIMSMLAISCFCRMIKGSTKRLLVIVIH